MERADDMERWGQAKLNDMKKKGTGDRNGEFGRGKSTRLDDMKTGADDMKRRRVGAGDIKKEVGRHGNGGR